MNKDNALVATTKTQPTGTKRAMLNTIRCALEEVVQASIKSENRSVVLTDKENALLKISEHLMDAFILCATHNFD